MDDRDPQMQHSDVDLSGVASTYKEYGSSEQLAKLYGALAKASGDFGEVKKTVKGQEGHRHYYYAPLSALISAIREPLRANGLAWVQSFGLADVGEVRSQLLHEEGARIESVIYFVPTKGGIKGLGAQCTYLRRYATCAFFCLDGEDDADSHPDSGDSVHKRRRQAPAPPERKQPEPSREPETAPDSPPAPSDADAPAESEAKRPSARAKKSEEPQGDPASTHQVSELGKLRKSLEIDKHEAIKLLKEVSGESPEAMTAEGADKLIGHLRSMAAEKS